MTRSKKRIGVLIGLLVGVSLLISVVSLSALYNVFFNQAQTRLQELVKGQVSVIESVAKFYEENKPPKDKFSNTPGGIASAVVERLLSSQEDKVDFGKTGRYYFGFVMDEKIYILHENHQFETIEQNKTKKCVISKSILKGKEGKIGSIVGKNYLGTPMMTAFAPVNSLEGFAYVASLDLSEVRKPFIKVALLLVFVSLIAILIGVAYFYRVSEPILWELAYKEKHMRSLLMSIFYGVVGIDIKGNCTFFNKSFFEILDIDKTKENLRGKSIGEIIYNNLDERIKEVYTPELIKEKCLEKGEDVEELRLKTKKGKIIEIISKDEPFVVEGREKGRVVSIMDVTELYDKKEKILETNSLLDMRIKHLKSLYTLTDLSLVPTDSFPDVITTVVDLISSKFFARPELVCVCLKIYGKTYQTEDFVETKYKIEQPIFSKGKIIGEIVVCYKEDWTRGEEELFVEEERDLLRETANRIEIINNRASADEKLRQVQKIEAVGTLAGGIAHDFNNILTGIQGHAFIAKDKLGKGHVAEKNIDNILGACKKAAGLVAQLLGFSRKGEVAKSKICLNTVLEDVVSLAKVSAHGILDFNTVIGDSEYFVYADSNQLYQIILNLTSNATDAIKSKHTDERGVIEISLTRVDTNFMYVATLDEFPSGRYVKISVKDNGTGMDEKLVEKIFDPFFTTKEFGKGTGLGLSVVHGIIFEHGGTVEVDSKVGVGTTFNIYLPEVSE